MSRLCLGTAFRGYWHGHTDEATAVRTVETALDLGVNFLDCANFYFQGRCEELLGKAIKGKRDDLVITTKVWSQIGEGPNDRGLSRFAIMREIERSLKRLNTDYVDIYLLHNWDPDTELDETLRAFDDLVRQGKVRYVGACNFTAAQVVEALWRADRGGTGPTVHLTKSVQPVAPLANRAGTVAFVSAVRSRYDDLQSAGRRPVERALSARAKSASR